MKFSSIVALAGVGFVQATHLEHHHHHHSFAQKAGDNPDENRKTYEKAVKEAANVVATEKSSENKRTSTHTAATAKYKKETYDKRAKIVDKHV